MIHSINYKHTQQTGLCRLTILREKLVARIEQKILSLFQKILVHNVWCPPFSFIGQKQCKFYKIPRTCIFHYCLADHFGVTSKFYVAESRTRIPLQCAIYQSYSIKKTQRKKKRLHRTIV